MIQLKRKNIIHCKLYCCLSRVKDFPQSTTTKNKTQVEHKISYTSQKEEWNVGREKNIEKKNWSSVMFSNAVVVGDVWWVVDGWKEKEMEGGEKAVKAFVLIILFCVLYLYHENAFAVIKKYIYLFSRSRQFSIFFLFSHFPYLFDCSLTIRTK